MLIETQKMDIKTAINLDEIQLNDNKEISVFVTKENGEVEYLRIVNTCNKIIVLSENKENVQLEQWEGRLPYKKLIREIEDKFLEEEESND